MRPTYGFWAVGVAIVLVAAGYGVSRALNDALQIVYTDKVLDAELEAVWTPGLVVERQLPLVDAIVLPDIGDATRVLLFGASHLQRAFAASGMPDVAIDVGTPARSLRSLVVRIRPDAASEVAIRYGPGGGAVIARTPASAAYGMNYFAALILGRGVSGSIDLAIEPALGLRLVDLGGVGEVPDPGMWLRGDYSHHATGFRRAMMLDAPYVDRGVMDELGSQFRQYVDRMATYGYNGIVVCGFLEFINFDLLGSGFDVYAEKSPYRERHVALRNAMAQEFEYARSIGFSVVLSTDMLALTRPLRRYFTQRFVTIDPGQEAFWSVYEAGLRELFAGMPQVDAVMIRVGEAGTIYNVDGWPYWSTLNVRDARHVQLMLDTFTRAAQASGKSVIFRSWTVGVGGIGDLHTNVDTYVRTLEPVASDVLVIATKPVEGDFYSYLPLNPTFGVGAHRRMIEFRARREFEGFASFPNYLAPSHQYAIQVLREANPRVDGIWIWTQGGGPLRQSPMSLYPFHGFWLLTDAEVYALGHLAWNPVVSIQDVTTSWIRHTMGGDARTVDAIGNMLFRSRDAVLKGMYIGPFARRRVYAFGLEPPPMLWIFEWDIVTGSSAVLSTIYVMSRDSLNAAVAEGVEASRAVWRMLGALEAIDRTTLDRPETFDRLTASLAYETSLLETLSSYRSAFLNYYRWLDTGDRDAYSAWIESLRIFELTRNAHLDQYARDVEFRAFSFFDADTGLGHARRAPAMMWLARLMIVAMLAALAMAMYRPRTSDARVREPAASLRLAMAPWASSAPVATEDRVHPVWIAAPFVVALLILAVSTSFMSPAALFLGSLAMASAITVIAMADGRAAVDRLRVLGIAIVAAGALPLFVISIRGPGLLWYLFWTSDEFRVVASIWGVFWMGWALFSVYASGKGDTPTRRLAVVALTLASCVFALSVATTLAGLEAVMTRLNDQLAVLPMGLSRILGITTHLNISTSIPAYAMVLSGLVLLTIGFVISGRRFRPASAARGST